MMCEELAIEAGARAMCDRVNGIGDYDENITQRRSGWVAQAKVGIDAYLAALAAEPDSHSEDDTPRTDCEGTGMTIQTERPCSCSAGDEFRLTTTTREPGVSQPITEKQATTKQGDEA